MSHSKNVQGTLNSATQADFLPPVTSEHAPLRADNQRAYRALLSTLSWRDTGHFTCARKRRKNLQLRFSPQCSFPPLKTDIYNSDKDLRLE